MARTQKGRRLYINKTVHGGIREAQRVHRELLVIMNEARVLMDDLKTLRRRNVTDFDSERFVFTTDSGTPLHGRNIAQRHFQAIAEAGREYHRMFGYTTCDTVQRLSCFV